MRYRLVVFLWMLLCSATSAMAQVSIGIGLPHVSIGINLPVFPELVQVPDYPVYYAPGLNSNYFFYDGMYWVYQNDNWYASDWYNGPWALVEPEAVPLFVLRVPVRYYRRPPAYFRAWQPNAPPHWGEHWGNAWAQHHSGWDRWNRSSAPAPAPLPTYQRQYSGDRYPKAEQQHALRSQNYRYQPHENVVRQHFEQTARSAPSSSERRQSEAPPARTPERQDVQRSNPSAQQQSGRTGAREQPPQREGANVQRAAPAQEPSQQRGPSAQQQRQPPAQGALPRDRGSEEVQRSSRAYAPSQPRGPAEQDQRQPPQQQRAAPREQQMPGASQENAPRSRAQTQEPRRGSAQEKERDKGEERNR
jgi:hypothetical protein